VDGSVQRGRNSHRPTNLATNSLTVTVKYKPSGAGMQHATVVVSSTRLDGLKGLMETQLGLSPDSKKFRMERTDSGGVAIFYDLEPQTWYVVVSFQSSNALVHTAVSRVGSKDWSIHIEKGPYGENTFKCNLFVYDMIAQSGLSPPDLVDRTWPREDVPPLAGSWADPSQDISSSTHRWEVVTTPQPGDIAAVAMPGGTGYSGHMGVVSNPEPVSQTVTLTKREHKTLTVELPGRTASQSSHVDEVVENDWGFRSGQTPTFRRYIKK